MTIRNALYLFSSLWSFGVFASTGKAMDEDSLKSYRVQTASVLKVQGDQAAHNELNRQANIAPQIKQYPAYIIREQGSKWNRTQLKCNDKSTADLLANNLKQVLTTGPIVVAPQTVTPGQKLLFEATIRHYW